MPLENVFSLYKRIFSRHRLLFVGSIVYFILVLGYGVGRSFLALREADELRMRVVELETQRRQQDQLLSTLTERTLQAEFLKPLKFEERWRDERTKQTVSRLVDYAEFAISKNDFERAERFYSEANQAQPTLTIPYYEGRLAYRRGDLQRAETKWLEAIKRDPEQRYPDLRLYLGVLYYQLGRVDEARTYLRIFATGSAQQ